MYQIGEKYLITTNNWFYGSDGRQYRAAHGTVTAILDSEQVLGIKANRHSTNWYVEIGNLIIAGCQIHYVLKTDSVEFNTVHDTSENNGVVTDIATNSRIYNADKV